MCKLWEQSKEDSNFGLCKANAPMPTVMILEAGRKYQIVWPSTGKDDYCFQFVPEISS